MGRPLRCNVCCVDTNDPTADLPPVTDCGGVIAVAFIDESDKPTDMNSKIVQYLAAFPDRLLFIMDVEKGGYGNLDYTKYPAFTGSDRCYSLALEKQGGGAGTWTDDIPEYILRDKNTETPSDVFSYITTIVNNSSDSSDEVRTIWKEAKQVSVFRDNSGSMRYGEVQDTYEKFIADLASPPEGQVVSIGDASVAILPKAIKRSNYNRAEDFICPFVYEHCCDGPAAETILTSCGLACLPIIVDDPHTLSFDDNIGPNSEYIVDDPCSLPIDPTENVLQSSDQSSNQNFDLSSATAIGPVFRHLQNLNPTSLKIEQSVGQAALNDLELGSQLFGSDLAISSNGDTIVVVEGEPVPVNILTFTWESIGAGNMISIANHNLEDGDIVRYGFSGRTARGLESILDFSSSDEGFTFSHRRFKVQNSSTNSFELREEGPDGDTIEITDNDKNNKDTTHLLAKITDQLSGGLRCSKICTYKRKHIPGDGGCDRNFRYELENSFVTSEPVANSLNSRASIDLSDDGEHLIVGTPDNGSLLSYIHTDIHGNLVNTTEHNSEYWSPSRPSKNNPKGMATGEWRVYDWNSSNKTWTQRGDAGTVPTNSSGGQEIGTMVSISSDGNTAVVSTNIRSAEGTITMTAWYPSQLNRGAVYVYDWDINSASWVQRGSKIEDFDYELIDEQSGYPRYFSVDANVNHIAISTFMYDPTDRPDAWTAATDRKNFGAVRVFKYDESTSDWVQLGNIISPVPDNDYAIDPSNADLVLAAEDTYFGNAVCLSKDGDNDYPRLAVMDINSVYVYDYDTATEKWVQQGDAISRGNELKSFGNGLMYREWPYSSVTSETKSPSIAFSEDKNTLIIGDYTPLNEDADQRGLVRTLQLIDNQWVDTNSFRGFTEGNEVYHFGNDTLVSRTGQDMGPHHCSVAAGEILVFSEPLKPHTNRTGGPTGQVQIYMADTVTSFPTVQIRCREKPQPSTIVPNNGHTTVTEHKLVFTLSSPPSNGTLFEGSDIYVTKGVLGELKPYFDMTTQANSLTVFEATLTVSNDKEEGEVIVKVGEGSFQNDLGTNNQASTFTMNYKVTTPKPQPPTLCGTCLNGNPVEDDEYTIRYAASVKRSDTTVVSSIPITYILQSRHPNQDWITIQALNNDMPANTVQTKSTLCSDHDTCRGHSLPFGIDKNMSPWEDTYINEDCFKRVYTIDFRIKASAETDEGDSLSAFSKLFKLYHYVAGDQRSEDIAGAWEREFTTTTDNDYDFTHTDATKNPPSLGKVGAKDDKLIISRFDMLRTNETAGLEAFLRPRTPFTLCPAMVVPTGLDFKPNFHSYYGFQRLLVSYPSRPHSDSDKGSIQHYVVGSPDATKYASSDGASQSLQESSYWFFEDRPFTDGSSAHTMLGREEEATSGPVFGFTIAPTRSQNPSPANPPPVNSNTYDVPTGFWFMHGTILTFEETYGYQREGSQHGRLGGCSLPFDYGYLTNSHEHPRLKRCDERQTFEYDLGPNGKEILHENEIAAEIATDGDGDTVAVARNTSMGNSTNGEVTVFRAFNTSLGNPAIQGAEHHRLTEIFSTTNSVVNPYPVFNHFAPTSLCLNDAGTVLGYTYRDEPNTTTNKGHVAIWEISEDFDPKSRAITGIANLLDTSSNLSVLKMDKSGNNIIVSCTHGAINNPSTETTYTGWAQVLRWNAAVNAYVRRGPRLDGPYKQFGTDCDISSDGNSIVVSSREGDNSSSSQATDSDSNRHGAIRCYTWNGSSYEQVGDPIRGTNYWSHLGFHLSYEADHVKRIAAFEGTDPDNPLRGSISMYKFKG